MFESRVETHANYQSREEESQNLEFMQTDNKTRQNVSRWPVESHNELS